MFFDSDPVSFSVSPKIGMHDIIGMLLVSADIGFKIRYRISASMLISADIITDKIIGCCFLDNIPESTPCFTCSLWTDVMFTYLSLVKQAKFALVVGIVRLSQGEHHIVLSRMYLT